MEQLGFLVFVVAVFAAIPASIAFGVVRLTKSGDEARLDELKQRHALSIPEGVSRTTYVKAATKTLGMFLLLGPLVGTAPIALILAIVADGNGVAWSIGSAFFGYVFGLLPALVTGVALIGLAWIHIRKEHRLPSRSHVAAWGGVLGLFVTVAMQLALSNRNLSVMFPILGVFAGAVCGALCFPIAQRLLVGELTQAQVPVVRLEDI